METVSHSSTPMQHHQTDFKTGPANYAPEVVHEHYLSEKPGTPALSIHSHHSTAALDRQDHPLPLWPETGDEPIPNVPSQYQGGFPPTLPVPPVEESSSEKRIWGIRKRLFLLLLVLAGLVILGIATGVGVGVGVRNKNANNGNPASTSPPETSSNAPPDAQCPFHANTQLQIPSGAKFLRLCGVDYSGPGEATDIANQRVPTFMDCLEACAKRDGCTGAGWGPLLPDRPARTICWMKNNLNLSHIALQDWNFGILLT